MNKVTKKNIIFVSIVLILFFIYSTIGFHYEELVFTMNRFFGADNQRAIEDMVVYSANHYRTSVHPLFVILTNPIGNLIRKITGDIIYASIILNSIIGACGVGIMYLYINLLNIRTGIKNVLILIFAFISSTILFSAVPETFSFGTLSLVLMYYVGYKIIKDIEENRYTKKTEKIFKIYFPITMILCFGITITNYVQSIIVLVAILYKIKKKDIVYNFKRPILSITFFILTTIIFVEKNILMFIISIFIFILIYLFEPNDKRNFSFGSMKKLGVFVITITLIIGTWGTSLQKSIFPSSGLFFSQQISEELNYIKVNDEKDESEKKLLSTYGKQVFESIIPLTLYSIIAPEPEFNDNNEMVFKLESIKNYTTIQYIGLTFWIIAIIGSIFLTIRMKIYFNYFIIISIIFNVLLHSLYGANESFIYSGNVSFLFILILANSMEKFKGLKQNVLKKVTDCIVITMVILLGCNNIMWAFNLKERFNNVDYNEKVAIESFNLPEERFFLFGMGNRKKLIYKDFKIIDIFTGEIIEEFQGEKDIIIPEEYKVKIEKKNGDIVEIIEDEKAVWIIENGETIEVTAGDINLPDFENNKYSKILKILNNEILINIVDGRPVPNLFVYDNSWYRDAAMASMVLEETGNVNLIKDWILNLKDPYDMQNAGVKEADNLGQALYMISLVSDKNHPLVDEILDEVENIKVDNYINGQVDFSERPVYTTKWLKYGLKKLNIEDNFLIPNIKDEYSNLFWMDYTDEFIEYTDTKNEFKDYPYLGWARRHTLNVDIPEDYILSKDYPITWEANASQADYDKLSVLSNKYVNKKISPTHLWHASEMFLYLLKIGEL